eukprot:TRINITY_DN22769_c0_g1_i5.p1 TRINITY_DN22769_c0_g1~~TRINITY_DN22769_c0_g1_i5.p1  ORF type:complete len:192 (+),score=22.59 TRINITY_DN22769_c0_g1_i5:171-746(+)
MRACRRGPSAGKRGKYRVCVYLGYILVILFFFVVHAYRNHGGQAEVEAPGISVGECVWSRAMAGLSIKGLTLKCTPNQYLVAPAGYAKSDPHDQPPRFDKPAGHVAATWKRVVSTQPRTTLVAEEDGGLKQHHTQKSFLFRFVDDIHSEFIPLDDNQSTLAIYSASRVGYGDMGANAKRIKSWLAGLKSAL